MTDVTPDPKTGKRIIDPAATRRALLTWPVCAACGARAANGHHIIQRGSPHFGDDVIENIVGICGSGTAGCHGALHGSPYWHESRAEFGSLIKTRRNSEWVAARVGDYLHVCRPDVIRYVLGKLGREPGAKYLRRFYPGALDDDGPPE